jgi:hypothetical protein
MNGESAKEDDLLCQQFLRQRGYTISELKIEYHLRHRHYSRQDQWGLGFHMEDTMRETSCREAFIDQFGFAILSYGAIEAIRPYAPILEIGAGSGYWAYELQRAGVDVIATDPGRWYSRGNKKPDGTQPKAWQETYTNVEKLTGLQAIRKYPGRTLLFVWPPYQARWPAGLLQTFTGNTVIYMGEGMGNACANDRFHEILDEQFSDQQYVRMPHFWGCYDRSLVIARKPKLLEDTSDIRSRTADVSEGRHQASDCP